MATQVLKLNQPDTEQMAFRLNQILKAIKGSVTREQRRWHAAGNLRALDDNLLRDIGIHRSQIIATVQSDDVEIRGGSNGLD